MCVHLKWSLEMHHITKGILTGNVQTCVLILSVTLLEAINPNIHI